MRAKNRSTKLLLAVITLSAAAVIWAYWPANQVLAIQDSEDMPSPIGIAFGQTLFLNVANTGATETPFLLR